MFSRVIAISLCLIAAVHCATSAFECFPSVSVVAGTKLTCILTNAPGTVLTGSSSCEARLYLCDEDSTFSIGDNETSFLMTLNNASLTSTGIFRFEFFPTVSGNFTVSGFVNQVKVGSVVPMKVLTGPIVHTPTSSTCAVENQLTGSTKCVAVGKDRFDNVVKTCTTTHIPGDSGSLNEVCTYPY